MKKISIVILGLLLTSCGDFPDYRYEQSEDYCVLTFPFAGGFFNRKYIGYLNITSTLRYLDSSPKLAIFVGEPSHIELEVGSVQKIEIDDKEYIPEFHQNYLHAELQYWGPAFVFNDSQTENIYKALQDGHNMVIHGRIEIGSQYETEIYNFFFEDKEEPFNACVNRLLDEDDLKQIEMANES
ncbi:hypothetical protein [Aliikangiella coralliicola]|uniref:Lipoprotein n=1 Tax=Aliikangiella coralliicola TaxID=2592383 RepID=A0A545UAR3_9GAMM|nr:hypothetical protein [Aliikangiella coralliicola]TQV86561.1 hypothetical protein FLL46_16785 [Aliikangiella coralliicola]